tara:strand:+ start:2393 stop:4654 length:2262 start_codon:yes stop_codon:yes gene_type:complete
MSEYQGLGCLCNTTRRSIRSHVIKAGHLNLLVLLAMLLWLTASPVHAQNAGFSGTDQLPRPAALEPAIRFWTRVYTEADTNSGFLHDAVNLAVIYRKVDYNRREIEAYRNQIRQDLQVLASGKRDGLTLNQQQVLDAWPDGVDNATLADAAGNVRFQLGQSDRFIAGLIRSGAYREHIEEVAAERGLPIELAALPHVESSFHPGAWSHAAAAGMWQFIRTTGQRFMRIDNVVDERMDPYTATYAAMSLLEYNYNLLGSWPLALTAYNHGAGGLARAVRATGTDDIATIISQYKGPSFGFASRNFYPQFLAVLDVERRARALFGVLHLDVAPEYLSFELDTYVEANVLADALGVSMDQLKFDNPALLAVVWEGGKRIPKGYSVKIQRNSVRGNLQARLSEIPDSQRYTFQTPDINYVVRSGDSLSLIASRFDTSVDQLVSLNRLRDRHTIRVGQTLLLPHDTDMLTHTLASNDEAVIGDEQVAANVSNSSTASLSGENEYIVRSGDTVSGIARRYGIDSAAIIAHNGLDSRGRIAVGQALQLPLNRPDTPEPQFSSVFPDEEARQPLLMPASYRQQSDTVPAAENEVLAIEPDTVNVEESNELAEVALTADPSDYSIAGDGSIEVQASETLGHYAEWLNVSAQELRQLNGMRFTDPVIIGQRLNVDVASLDQDAFELRRREYHLQQQQTFFKQYRIRDISRHELSANESISRLARQRYSVPLWLLRQYNPDLDFSRVRVGQTIVFPVVDRIDGA